MVGFNREVSGEHSSHRKQRQNKYSRSGVCQSVSQALPLALLQAKALRVVHGSGDQALELAGVRILRQEQEVEAGMSSGKPG